MGNLGLLAALTLCLMASAALSGTVQGRFAVGITLGEGDPHDKRRPPGFRYTWGAAAISVSRAGYQNVRRVEASGDVYWFTGERGGSKFLVAVTIATGRIAAVLPD